MTTITIDLDDDLARHVEESSRREHKSVSDWVRERVKPEADRAAILAVLEIAGVGEWLSARLARPLWLAGR